MDFHRWWWKAFWKNSGLLLTSWISGSAKCQTLGADGCRLCLYYTAPHSSSQSRIGTWECEQAPQTLTILSRSKLIRLQPTPKSKCSMKITAIIQGKHFSLLHARNREVNRTRTSWERDLKHSIHYQNKSSIAHSFSRWKYSTWKQGL